MTVICLQRECYVLGENEVLLSIVMLRFPSRYYHVTQEDRYLNEMESLWSASCHFLLHVPSPLPFQIKLVTKSRSNRQNCCMQSWSQTTTVQWTEVMLTKATNASENRNPPVQPCRPTSWIDDVYIDTMSINTMSINIMSIILYWRTT